MSYFKPDYNYDPLQSMTSLADGKDPSPSKMHAVKSDLTNAIKLFSKELTDAELHRFYGTTSLATRTNVNVFDSVAFFKKFSDAYMFTIKKTFPELSETVKDELIESTDLLHNLLAQSLNSANVENKYLLILLLGMLEGMLNYENY